MYAKLNGSRPSFASATDTVWNECGAKRTPLTAAAPAAANDTRRKLRRSSRRSPRNSASRSSYHRVSTLFHFAMLLLLPRVAGDARLERQHATERQLVVAERAVAPRARPLLRLEPPVVGRQPVVRHADQQGDDRVDLLLRERQR